MNNIFKELYSDLGVKRENNNLTDWAKQGVLLLNAIMSVEKDTPLSHKGMGWEIFTDRVISELNRKETPVVFLLWGSNARSKKGMIDNKKHLVLECAHPSPLSAYNGFFGCGHFVKANEYLKTHGLQPIDWGAL